MNDQFSAKAQSIFKKVPYIDRWSANAKVLMAAVAVIPPIIFTLFYICFHLKCQYDNKQVDKKYAKLNQAQMKAKKND